MKNYTRFKIVDKFDLGKMPTNSVEKLSLHLIDDGMGSPVFLPVFVAKGGKVGPVLGVTAAVHGNELNGVKVIHKLIQEIESQIDRLCGTVIAVPIVNVIGAMRTDRYFNNGEDLNRIMPGKAKGNSSEQYVSRFIKQVVKKLDYLVDLHTASFGRVNSLYVRADMENRESSVLAKLQHPQIIVHNKGHDGSLRSAAGKLGIPAITVEVGDPQRFQNSMIRNSLLGVYNILSYFGMLPISVVSQLGEPVLCKKSYWMYTEKGGILEVFPHVADRVLKGEKVAKLVDVFGATIKTYVAPESGIVIGKSINPISQTGARILHLGIE